MKTIFDRELVDKNGTVLGYSIIIYANGEILLVNNYPSLDEWGHENDGCYRVKNSNPYFGMKVYRLACREILNFLYEKKPPLLSFCTGCDDTRIPLYEKFSHLLEKHHYICYKRENGSYYFVRENS